MNINLNKKLLDFNGDTLKMNGEESTIGNTIRFALLNEPMVITEDGRPIESKISGEEKFKLFKLVERMEKCEQPKEFKISLEEATLIKERVGKIFPPIYVGRVWSELGE